MTIEEQQLSELLKRSVPEPPLELSADRVTARHVNQSPKSWLMPALAAAAVVLVAGAGAGLNAIRHPTSPSASSSPQRKVQATTTSTAGAVTPGPAEAPAVFNPLVLPVNFGWLPTGFTENQPETGVFSINGGLIDVTTTQASFGASAADGRGFTVTVAARGAAPVPRVTGMASQNLGSGGPSTVTGTAPDINGRPAKWLADGLEWEYATGGWATLLAGGETKAQAQQGWGRYCPVDTPKGPNSGTTNRKTSCSPYTPSAEFRALFEKVASNLTWTPQSFTFPFRFTHALPNGWTVSEVSGELVNGRLTSAQTNLVPKEAPNTKDPLNIQAFSSGNTADCAGFAFSGTTFATYNGVTWAIQADHSGATACAGARMTKKNTGSVGIGFEQDTIAYLPTPLGPSGVKIVLPLFKFLGTNPANWTTNPFAALVLDSPSTGHPGGSCWPLPGSHSKMCAGSSVRWATARRSRRISSKSVASRMRVANSAIIVSAS